MLHMDKSIMSHFLMECTTMVIEIEQYLDWTVKHTINMTSKQ